MGPFRGLQEIPPMKSTLRHVHAAASVAAFLMTVPVAGWADEIVRRNLPDFPIASSVSVPATARLVYVSGTLADVVKADAPAGSIERLGDTATQTASVLGKIEKELAASGLTMADVVKMNVFMVGDPAKGGTMDFAGLMQAYSRFFGEASRGNLPARTTVQVAALPLPGALVEIEVIAAR
jgi:enamine deaminase RidA (YjgF/YER057c/UK114 family)